MICFSVGQEVAVLLTAGQPSPRNAQQWNYHPSPGQTYPAELLHVPGTDRCPPLAVEGSGCCFSGLRHKRCIFLTLHQMLALCSTQNHPANLCANCHARNTDFPALPSIFLVLSKSIPVLKFRQDHRNFPQLFGTFSWFLGISLFILGIAESLAGITGWNPRYFLNILECFLAISAYYHTPF